MLITSAVNELRAQKTHTHGACLGFVFHSWANDGGNWCKIQLCAWTWEHVQMPSWGLAWHSKACLLPILNWVVGGSNEVPVSIEGHMYSPVCFQQPFFKISTDQTLLLSIDNSSQLNMFKFWSFFKQHWSPQTTSYQVKAGWFKPDVMATLV